MMGLNKISVDFSSDRPFTRGREEERVKKMKDETPLSSESFRQFGITFKFVYFRCQYLEMIIMMHTSS